MAVLETRSPIRPDAVRAEAGIVRDTVSPRPVMSGPVMSRPVAAGARPASVTSPERLRRMPARSAYAESVRACRNEVQAGREMVDDVPAWVLVVCGIVFGVLVLLALALLGGPAYA